MTVMWKFQHIFKRGLILTNYHTLLSVLTDRPSVEPDQMQLSVSTQNSEKHHENMPIKYWPLKPCFYIIVKLVFTGVYIFFLFLFKNIDCRYSLEPPRWGSSNENPQSMFWAEICKIIELFIWKVSVFGDEIFYILGKACFCNDILKYRIFRKRKYRTNIGQSWRLRCCRTWHVIRVYTVCHTSCNFSHINK